MATISSNDDFVNACNHLITQGQLPVTVARFIDATARKVYDETTPLTDITPDTATLETALDSANAEIVVQASETTQATTARSNLKSLMSGLQDLSATDKGYAVYCRLFAWRNGANQATIDGIINRATATSYITNLPEWQNLPAASRVFMAKVLEADAALAQVLLLILG